MKSVKPGENDDVFEGGKEQAHDPDERAQKCDCANQRLRREQIKALAPVPEEVRQLLQCRHAVPQDINEQVKNEYSVMLVDDSKLEYDENNSLAIVPHEQSSKSIRHVL